MEEEFSWAFMNFSALYTERKPKGFFFFGGRGRGRGRRGRSGRRIGVLAAGKTKGNWEQKQNLPSPTTEQKDERGGLFKGLVIRSGPRGRTWGGASRKIREGD